MKRIVCFLSAFIFCLPLASCMMRTKFKDDIRTEDLAAEITRELNEDTDLPLEYIKDDTGFTDEYFTAPDYVTEHSVFYARSTDNLNELGIYHVKDGYADDLATLLKRDYLQASYEKNKDWYDSYIPLETPKLRDAEVRTFGNYVIYAIFDAEDRDTVFDAVEDALEKM